MAEVYRAGKNLTLYARLVLLLPIVIAGLLAVLFALTAGMFVVMLRKIIPGLRPKVRPRQTEA